MMLPITIILKTGLLFLLAPLLQGFIKKVKGRLQGRSGPPVLQPFRDVFKLLHKDLIISRETSWVFTMAPFLAFSAVFVASLMVPWLDRAPDGLFSGLLVFVYLLGMAKFVVALAGLDASGAFGGMASSREMAVSALAEPALLLSLLTLALPANSLRLENLMIHSGELPVMTAPGLLAAVSFFLVLLAEVGRIPADNPDTHLELTMIHEGMVLEYTGPHLALLHLVHWLKQLTLVVLMMNAFAPVGMVTASEGSLLLAALYFVGKLLLAGILLALTETGLAKMRLFQMMDLVGFSFVLSVTSLLFVTIGR